MCVLGCDVRYTCQKPLPKTEQNVTATANVALRGTNQMGADGGSSEDEEEEEEDATSSPSATASASATSTGNPTDNAAVLSQQQQQQLAKQAENASSDQYELPYILGHHFVRQLSWIICIP